MYRPGYLTSLLRTMTAQLLLLLLLLTLASVSRGEDAVIIETNAILSTRLDALHIWDDLREQHRRRWVEPMNVWNEVLVIPDGTDAAAARVVVSNRIMTDDEYQNILDVWENQRRNITHLSVSCSVVKRERRRRHSQKSCVCARFERTNVTAIESGVDRKWTLAGIAAVCSDVPRLPENVFDGFDNVTFVKMSDVMLPELDAGAFSRLIGLRAILLQYVSLSASSLDSLVGSFCGGTLGGLVTVKIRDVRVDDSSADPDGIVRLFGCDRDVGGTVSEGQDLVDGRLYPLNIGSVRLTFCGVSRLTGKAFGSILPTGLLSLDLSYNYVTSIHADTFANFTNLLELLLNNNNLIQLPPTLLGGLRSLLYLDLSANNLTEFSVARQLKTNRLLNLLNLRVNKLGHIGGSFSALPHLVYIYLDNNSLSEITPNTFENCTSVRSILIAHNYIANVDPFAFRGTTNLSWLDMSMNRLSNSTALRNMMWNMKMRAELELFLDHNHLTTVPDRFFHPPGRRHPFKVSLISLSHNKIRTVDGGAFMQLAYLRTLLLDNNELSSLGDKMFVDLMQLQTLNLSFNHLTSIHPRTFPRTSARIYIYLNHNRLTSLPERMRVPNNLANLYLGSNQLTEIPTFSRTVWSLGVLDLSHNRLTNVTRERLAQFPNLEALNLRGNSLRSLPPAAFANNARLRMLILGGNGLNLNFSLDYFSEFRHDYSTGRARIQYLGLDGNSIKPDGNLCLHASFCDVQQLNLTNNPIGVWDDDMHVLSLNNLLRRTPVTECRLALTHLWLRNCNLTMVSERALKSAKELEFLDLSHNHLSEFKPLSIQKRFYTVLLESNPIKCNCRMKWLKSDNYSRYYSVTKCIHSMTGKSTLFDTIPESEFLCRLDGHCAVGATACKCYSDDESNLKQASHLMCSERRLSAFPVSFQSTIKVIHFEGNGIAEFSTSTMSNASENVRELYLDRNKITRLESDAFEMFPRLEVVGLSENGLETLSSGTFRGLRQLRELFLHDNRIRAIEPGTFQHIVRLRVLTLHNNDLQVLSPQTMDDLDSLPLSNLSLYDNPWSCQCDNSTFKKWILTNKDILSNITEIQCNGTSVVMTPDDELACEHPFKRFYVKDYQAAPAAVTSTVLLVLIVTGLVLAYVNRHMIQVRLYNSRFRLRLTRPENADCVYDAVIMFDSENDAVRRWIVDVLRPRLLEFDPRFQLFVPDVDLCPGVDELNCIAEGVTKSRRTVVVVAEGSYDNPYVLYSFKVAYHHMTTDDKLHDVMLILADDLDLESLMAVDEIDPNFGAYLTAGKRMRMSHRRFWSELNFFLPAVRGCERRVMGWLEMRWKSALRAYVLL